MDLIKMQNALKSAQSMLLGLVILSIVNIFAILTNMDIYFPLSIYTALFGTALYYTEKLLIALIIGIAAIIFFGIMYFVSRKHYVGLIIATVFYIFDFALMVFLLQANLGSAILDILLHMLALGVMIYGIVMAVKMSKLPVENNTSQIYNPNTAQVGTIFVTATDTPENTDTIEKAETTVE